MQFDFMIIAMILTNSSFMLAQRSKHESMHGTINILLANKNGMVLVTDSRGTDVVNGEHYDNSPKLFQIDDSTVCSIAGFGTDSGPSNDVRLEAAGVVRDFRENLAQSNIRLTFDRKLQTLGFEIINELQRLSIEYGHSNRKAATDHYELQLLMAGYDLDGFAKLAKAVISVKTNYRGDTSPEVKVIGPQIESIHGSLLFLTAGVDDSVEARLTYPDTFPAEKALQAYSIAKKTDTTSTLSIDQLEELADYLEQDAAKTAPLSWGIPVVGGSIQKAILHNGGVRLSLPPNLRLSAKPNHFAMLDDVTYHNFGTSLPYYFGTSTVIVNGDFVNTGWRLDQSLIYGGRCDHCYLYFDGGHVFVDSSVVISSSYLVVGPHVTADNVEIKRLRETFPELKVISYTDIHLSKQDETDLWHSPS